MLSPEERAVACFNNYCESDQSISLTEAFATAIRDAVTEERDAILTCHTSALNQLQDMQENGYAADLSVMGRIILVQILIDQIRARSEKTAPAE